MKSLIKKSFIIVAGLLLIPHSQVMANPTGISYAVTVASGSGQSAAWGFVAGLLSNTSDKNRLMIAHGAGLGLSGLANIIYKNKHINSQGYDFYGFRQNGISNEENQEDESYLYDKYLDTQKGFYDKARRNYNNTLHVSSAALSYIGGAGAGLGTNVYVWPATKWVANGIWSGIKWTGNTFIVWPVNKTISGVTWGGKKAWAGTKWTGNTGLSLIKFGGNNLVVKPTKFFWNHKYKTMGALVSLYMLAWIRKQVKKGKIRVYEKNNENGDNNYNVNTNPHYKNNDENNNEEDN